MAYYTLLNYLQYSLHLIFTTQDLSFTFCVMSFIYLFQITPFSPYCTGVSCPVQAMLNHSFIMVQNGLHLLFSLFISFNNTFGMSLSKTSFLVSPLTAFLSILRVTIPEHFHLKAQCRYVYFRIQILLLGNFFEEEEFY